MKTALVSTSYLDGFDFQGNSRLVRTFRYLEYYDSIKEILGFDDIWLIDNGSREVICDPSIHFMRFPHLLHNSDLSHHYPYAWRTLWFLRALFALGYEKIIHCETDCYVLTEKLASQVRGWNYGWHALWGPMHGYPMSEFMVINKDVRHSLDHFITDDYNYNLGRQMEKVLPITNVHYGFIADRYEHPRYPAPSNCDMYSQAGPSFKPVFRC